MAIKIEGLLGLLLPGKIEFKIADILMEYSVLREKLNTADRQSRYFRKAIESKKTRLLELQKEFEEIRILFNESSVDFLIEQLKKTSEKTSYRKKPRSLIYHITWCSLSEKVKFFYELLHYKDKIKQLMPIDHYEENPEEFLKMLG